MALGRDSGRVSTPEEKVDAWRRAYVATRLYTELKALQKKLHHTKSPDYERMLMFVETELWRRSWLPCRNGGGWQ